MPSRTLASLLAATALTGASSAEPFEDFGPATAADWRFIADRVMGGVSEGRIAIVEIEGQPALRLTGRVSTDNNGGFIQARRDIDGLPPSTIALTLTVRGNGETYHVLLKSRHGTRPWHNYKASFPATDDWTQVTLPLTEFAPSRDELPPRIAPEDITGIGLAGYGRDFTADLTVARIVLD
ncbi:CIA30 family protein [Roseovarius sp. SCSIO 43702]|uniref:CIA30 family protein n=1 Tax=Roseovarius sp. SCSIO 43702 TaxID=2823043 RepID=UPI001C739381|nr:CIA30 family protein [Roseovarius sp. SCSIO 43702]QYX55464.1 CIA30 family protein [Roseovarius sp. SCSIO 43702]